MLNHDLRDAADKIGYAIGKLEMADIADEKDENRCSDIMVKLQEAVEEVHELIVDVEGGKNEKQ